MSADLETIAAQIPSMGGKTIGPFLRSVARGAASGTSIVEVGTWLGAGTAHLALGVRDRVDDTVDIHCYDRWSATKAIALAPFEDTLTWVRATLSHFQAPIRFHKGEINKATWAGGPISVYIDDAAKGLDNFLHVLKTFGPHWIPGETVIVLMDYYYWKKLKGWRAAEYKCPQSFIERHPEHFSVIRNFREQYKVPFSNEAFRYDKPMDFSALRPESLGKFSPRVIRIGQRVLSRIGIDL
jgi:hypothetical protein